jgi:ABC-type multidrug transport system fused ATPase/permease subunit
MNCKFKTTTKEKLNMTKQHKYANFFKFLKQLSGYKKYFFFYSIVASAFVALNFFVPIITGNLLASLVGSEFDLIVKLLIVYAVLELAGYGVQLALSLMGNKFISQMISKFRLTLLGKILNTKTQFFDDAKTGDLVERSVTDASTLGWGVLRVIKMVLEIIANLFFVGYIFILNVYIGLIIVAFIIIYYIIDRKKNSKFLINQKEFRAHGSLVTNSVVESANGIRDIKALNAKENALDKFSATQKTFYEKYFKRETTNHLYWTALRTLSLVFFITTIGVGLYLIGISKFTLPALLIVYSGYRKIVGVAEFFSLLKEEVSLMEVSAQRVYDLMDNDKYSPEKFGTVNLDEIRGDIELKNVTFSYNQNTKLFQNLNLKIKAGQSIGIVGESGGGKSTLLEIISKMYDIQEGQILLDGHDINTLTEATIRKAITYVTQNPYIFNDTILNNLKLSNPEATMDEIVAACKMANIHDFIIERGGYDAWVGEKGVQLSGGQRQRIALARALLNKNKIILLDEATSALDNQSQRKIKQAIDNATQNNTIIIVAHRLSTIKNCDKILVMKNGEIVSMGKHQTLLKNNEYYKSLYHSKNNATE